MTELRFQKWQATGNDFIIVDNRSSEYSYLGQKQIEHLCHRKFGIGADGFMMIQESAQYDFEMLYFNADGKEAEMCGNGARSIIGYTNALGLIKEKTTFLAKDGPHNGEVLDDGSFKVKMVDVDDIDLVRMHGRASINTGVPHLIEFVEDVNVVNVVERGRKLRHDPLFQPAGTNVNFVQEDGKGIKIRTYERGVEDETLSCGTGAVASAIASFYSSPGKYRESVGRVIIPVKVEGGELLIEFNQTAQKSFKNIFLTGPAKIVFEGKIKI